MKNDGERLESSEPSTYGRGRLSRLDSLSRMKERRLQVRQALMAAREELVDRAPEAPLAAGDEALVERLNGVLEDLLHDDIVHLKRHGHGRAMFLDLEHIPLERLGRVLDALQSALGSGARL